MSEKRGGASQPQIKVFGTWFDLNDMVKIQPIQQAEEEEEEEGDEEEEEGAMGAGGGGEGGEGTEGTDPSPPERLTQQTMGTAKWAASACCIKIDARLSGTATGGREPRIISLAASHIASGKVLASFHEYIKIDQSADAAAVRGVHGLDFLTLQERASNSFKVVGSNWIDWLRTRVGSAKTATLVTAGGLKGGAYAVLASELARASLELPSTAAWTVLDLAHAAGKQKVYARVGISEWPHRKKPTAAQQRDRRTPGPELSLENMCAYSLRTAAAAAPPAPPPAPPPPPDSRATRFYRPAPPPPQLPTAPTTVEELCGDDVVHASAKMAAIVLEDLRTRGVVGKTVAQPLTPFMHFGLQLARYEEHRRNDPVPAPWEEYTGRGPPLETGDGPRFTPQMGWATLSMPGYPAAGVVRLGALGFTYDNTSITGKVPAVGMHVYTAAPWRPGYLGKITSVNPTLCHFHTDTAFTPSDGMAISLNGPLPDGKRPGGPSAELKAALGIGGEPRAAASPPHTRPARSSTGRHGARQSSRRRKIECVRASACVCEQGSAR